MLTTRVRPTDGRAMIGGVDVGADPVRARSLLAVVPQRSNLDRSISIRRNLIFHAAYHGVPARRGDRPRRRAARAVRAAASARDVKPDLFSGGQSQRVMIARALMHEPQVLFLDEPTTGLDPAARLFVWDRLRELRDRGVTLILTTHDMDEAAALADRVGIMDHGKLLALDTPEALMRSLAGSSTLELSVAAPRTATCRSRSCRRSGSSRGVERGRRRSTTTRPTPTPAERRLRLYVSGRGARSSIAPAATLAGRSRARR